MNKELIIKVLIISFIASPLFFMNLIVALIFNYIEILIIFSIEIMIIISILLFSKLNTNWNRK